MKFLLLKICLNLQFFYELFLNEKGAKISKSKGNDISIDQWLRYAPKDSMALYMYQSPGKAKKLFFDVIPKNVDEYIIFNQKYHLEEDQSKKFSNPLYHIHNGSVPKINMHDLTFNLLVNLASVCNPDSKEILWQYVKKYAPNANREESKYLDQLIDLVINYYNDFVKTTKS